MSGNRANRWQMHRAGLLNFWYYDEQEFVFADGKLLLRGSNGSGKSVTMQSFLPVLLDGKKTPDRLDPFGSKARRMEDYLLGEKEVVDREERTGYLYLEYKRKNTDQYLTTGIGLQAKRNRPMKFWGFVITDNRRIGEEIQLYKQERQGDEIQKIPRSRVELENVLGDGGQVVQTQGEYMKLVNKHIFGFDSLDAYEDLIKLLIQLRSPKLSKDFRPTVIYEILEAALPPLTDEDLRHLSDSIEQMDQTKQQIEQLERELAALTKINQAYDTYNQRYAADLAIEYRKAVRRSRQEEQVRKQLQDGQVQFEQELVQLKQELMQLEQDYEVLEKQRQRLASHEVWQIEQERKQEQERLEKSVQDSEMKEQRLTEQKRKELELKQLRQEAEAKAEQLKHKIADQLDLMNEAAVEASFASHEMNEADYERQQQSGFDFTLWKKEAAAHKQILAEMEEELRNFETLKDRIQAKHKELADEQYRRDQKQHEEQDWLRTFEQDKDALLQRIHAWVQNHTDLGVDELALQGAARSIYGLYDDSDYEEVKQPFASAVEQYVDRERQRQALLRAEAQQLEQQMDEKKEELNEWQQKKDPEPKAHPATLEARQALCKQGAVFAPFYALVEFREDVPEPLQQTIEATMLATGLLDSLVTAEPLTVKHDRVLRAQPQLMAHTLADYLQPDRAADTQVPLSEVEAVLQSIRIGHDETSDSLLTIEEDGSYRIGLVQGHAVPVEQVRFIGRTARIRYRETQMQNIQQELAALEARKQRVEAEIAQLDRSIAGAREAWSLFPQDRDLRHIDQQLQQVRMQIEHHESQLHRLSRELRELDGHYQEMKHHIHDRTRELDLEVTHAAYREARQYMEDYEKALLQLENYQLDYSNQLRQVDDLDLRLDELEEEWLELKGDLNVLQDQIARIRKNLASIEEQLAEAGADNIHRQIQAVQEKLTQTELQLKERRERLPKRETQLENLQEKLHEQQNKVVFWQQLKEAWQLSLKAELARGFVKEVLERDSNLYEAGGQLSSAAGLDHGRAETVAVSDESLKDIDKAAEQLEKLYGHLVKERDKSQVESRLTSQFYQQQSDLMEYRMRDYPTAVKKPKWMETSMEEPNQEPFRPLLEQWEQKSVRRIIELDWRGQQVSPYFVWDNLQEMQAQQQNNLLEQDKLLYEEILFKSVGNKLRSRIRRAEQWTQQMAALMENRDTSSGLTFSIRWRPRTAETEAELDTKDLVEILKQDARLLREDDLDKVTTHFRSKIETAKRWMEEKGEGQTLLQVLKEVLDYRKWFSFVLYYQRTNEPRRELTNNKFYTFSGGEKAMAMYIPLFTACYSRYQEASDTAPYIISLDEAFAGVDENNIREMFEIVEQLGFDYIMNSQVLWGDYDTISSLAVYELVRPKNADHVGVLRYQWDGSKIVLQLEQEPEDLGMLKKAVGEMSE